MIDFVLHFDKHLLEFVHAYGTWVYGLLFAIVFAETGFVVTPFLPGDSLLFAVGAAAWVGLCVLAGVLFGNVPIVKNNFSLVTIGIVAVSLLPIAVEYVRHRARR